jgi:membrane protease YdiL (CAAX protease family)
MRWPSKAFRFWPTTELVLLGIGIVLIGLVVATIVLSILHLLPSLVNPQKNLMAVIGAVFVFVEAPIVVLVIARLPRLTSFSLRELGFVLPTWRTVGIAVLGTVTATLLTAAVGSALQAVTHQHHTQDVVKLFLGLHDRRQVALFALYAIALAPVAEETVFRVFIFNVGLRYGGFWWGAAVSGILFGLAHGSLLDAIPLACVGMVFCGVYYVTRNAFASMISHGLFNALSLVALLFLPQIAQ